VNILVTGAAGFLGSHLCESLLLMGHKVIGLDNFYTGSNENIENLRKLNGFQFIEGDVTERIDVNADGIFNLACPASPIHYQRNPVETIRTSFLGALNVLENAQRNNITVLQASTSEVYGDPNVTPQPEEYWGNVNPIGIRSCYDEGKRSAETLFFDFHREYGTKIKIARIFNTYGPRMAVDDGRVVSNFIVQALRNEPITIYGSGHQTRSFCYATDLVQGLIKLFFSNESLTGPINLGNPNEFTMLELAEKVIQITNSKSKVVYLDLPKDDPKQRRPLIVKANELLGWNPTVELNQGLELTVKYFNSKIH
jgi:UDP-glucuronate decarboxylase